MSSLGPLGGEFLRVLSIMWHEVHAVHPSYCHQLHLWALEICTHHTVKNNDQIVNISELENAARLTTFGWINSLSSPNYGVFRSCRYFTLFRLSSSCSHTASYRGVLMLLSGNSKPFTGFNRARLGLKWTISNALFNLVNNASSQYWKQGWTDPCSDLCAPLIPLPSTTQLKKLIQLQGNQVQEEQ